MPKTAKHALKVLAAPELRAAKPDLKQLQTATVDMLQGVSNSENRAAKAAPIAGILLQRVKASLPHGEFTPWLQKLTGEEKDKDGKTQKRTTGALLPRLSVRQLQYYMKLSLVFLEKTKLAKPDLLALGDGKTALDLGSKHEAKAFMAALDEFVGDRSLNELLIKHDIKSVGLKTELTAEDDDDPDDDGLTPAQRAAQERENAWLAAWNPTQQIRATLTDPNKLQLLDAKKVEQLKDELVESAKLANARLDALRKS